MRAQDFGCSRAHFNAGPPSHDNGRSSLPNADEDVDASNGNGIASV